MFKSVSHICGTKIKFDLFQNLLSQIAEIIYEDSEEHSFKSPKDKLQLLMQAIFDGGFYGNANKLRHVKLPIKKTHCLNVTYNNTGHKVDQDYNNYNHKISYKKPKPKNMTNREYIEFISTVKIPQNPEKSNPANDLVAKYSNLFISIKIQRNYKININH